MAKKIKLYSYIVKPSEVVFDFRGRKVPAGKTAELTKKEYNKLVPKENREEKGVNNG
jgi:hypothetical protein